MFLTTTLLAAGAFAPAAVTPSTSASPLNLHESLAVHAVEAAAPQGRLRGMGIPNSPFSYDYAQIGLVLADAEGFGLEFSKVLDGPWIAVGRVADLDIKEGGNEADVQLISVGAGYVHNLDPNLDVLVTAQLEYIDVDPDQGRDADDLGIRARAGTRYLLNPQVEFFGGLSLFTNFDSDFVFDGGGLYHFNQNFSAFGQLEHDEDDVITIGVRYNF